MAQNYTDIEKLFEILEEEVQIRDPKSPIKMTKVGGEIEFKKVSFAYEGKKIEAVRNINLKILPGESVALVGRSGAGKTTLVKLLMRFYDVDEGSILVDGINVNRFSKSGLRALMGVVPQEPILFNNTIGYNIAYGKENASQEDIVSASKIARIHDFIKTLPNGYNSKVGERGIKLSGGQKQRVAIARMILSKPDIIIFDEATSQLDSESEKLIQEGFWRAAEGKTTIIIAHRLSTVMRTKKIVVMDEGRIIEKGTHRELLKDEGSLYKKFWDLQIKLD
jgi:ABC-type multidrug transport system fused ATPase/permease subunit